MKPTNLNKGFFTRKDYELHSQGKQLLDGKISDQGKEALEGLLEGEFSTQKLLELESVLWKPTFYDRYRTTIQFSTTLLLGILLGIGGILFFGDIKKEPLSRELPLNQSDESSAVPLVERTRDISTTISSKGIHTQMEGPIEKKEIEQEIQGEIKYSELPTKGIPMLVPVGRPNEVKLKVSTIQVPLFYVGQYKWVDYEKLYPEQYKEIELSGTEAIFENKFKVRVENGYTPIQRTSYRTKVGVAMYYLEKGKMEGALKEMKRLLTDRPDDVNLNFYSGILTYQKGDYESALEFFKNVKSAYPPLFEQEALWYEGLCLKELGRTESALKIFREVQLYDGFYSIDASKEINKLEGK
ncbi:MAG: tetratricopeptide repeat protein [Bacteroidia bacterium]|nr:tetratricopeptide repeat protein [Bacteroidia bacterium]